MIGTKGSAYHDLELESSNHLMAHDSRRGLGRSLLATFCAGAAVTVLRQVRVPVAAATIRAASTTASPRTS